MTAPAAGRSRAVEVVTDAYQDSVRLLEAARAMRRTDGVDWAAAVMATPANLEALAAEGFEARSEAESRPHAGHRLDDAGANDLVLAVQAADEDAAAAGVGAGRRELFGSATPAPEAGPAPLRVLAGSPADPSRTAADHIDAAIDATPGANAAVISVPGPYAALEAHKALTRRCHVLLFSDNVTLSDEIALKRRACEQGLLMMGPGAGTARLGGVGLGFANRVRSGPVGVVSAAGTGAQEVMSLLEQRGAGVSGVIGVGGRDLSGSVGGLMTLQGLRAFDRCPATEVILLVSKPPAPRVARRVLRTPLRKPMVAALMGIGPADIPATPAGVTVCATLEQGVTQTLTALGLDNGDAFGDNGDAFGESGDNSDTEGLEAGREGLETGREGLETGREGLEAGVARAVAGLAQGRRRLVGLFSGGTLCYEAMAVASAHIGPIRSNTPLRDGWNLSGRASDHVCLDLGEEDYTRGRPHPMIDPAARLDLLGKTAADRRVAAVLLDVVLGDGSHPDPAGVLAPAAARAAQAGAVVVAYVLGTDLDPQGLAGQRRVLLEAGCIVPRTAARAALAAAAVVNRDPALVRSL